jgi:hypothetical protein
MLSDLAMRVRFPVSVLLAALLAGGSASAQPTDVAQAEGVLVEVSGSPRAALVAREVQKAREALDRARSARLSGDSKHAEQLEGVARAWAGAARDVLAAVLTEEQAQAAQQKISEARSQSEHERTLLEENLSRRGRAEAELKRAEAEAAARPPVQPPKEKGKKGGKGASKGGKKGAKK